MTSTPDRRCCLNFLFLLYSHQLLASFLIKTPQNLLMKSQEVISKKYGYFILNYVNDLYFTQFQNTLTS